MQINMLKCLVWLAVLAVTLGADTVYELTDIQEVESGWTGNLSLVQVLYFSNIIH